MSLQSLLIILPGHIKKDEWCRIDRPRRIHRRNPRDRARRNQVGHELISNGII